MSGGGEKPNSIISVSTLMRKMSSPRRLSRAISSATWL